MMIKLTVCCKPNGVGHGCIADGFHCFRVDSNKTARVRGTVQHGKDQHTIVLRGIWLVAGYKSRFTKHNVKNQTGTNSITKKNVSVVIAQVPKSTTLLQRATYLG